MNENEQFKQYPDQEPTPLEIAEYQFATIEYDYKIHPEAAESIRAILRQLAQN